jgi:hypothetical protein
MIPAVRGKTYHVRLVRSNGEEYRVEDAHPTRADARKHARKLVRSTSFDSFKIDARRIARVRRNGSQHLSVAAPSLLNSPRWTAIYRNPDVLVEVVVTTTEPPAPERRFKVVGHGKPVFKAVSITELNAPPARKRRSKPKEDVSTMATKTRKRTRKQEADATDDDALLNDEELEDLDDLDAIEDSAEPEDVADLEDEDADDLEDDEDEEDEETENLGALSVKELRKRARGHGLSSAKAKGASKPQLVKYLEKKAASADEDVEDEKPARKRSKGKGKGGQAPPTRELPKGKLGAEAIATAAGTDSRAVRVYLRKMDGAEKFKVDGRWAFTQKQVDQLAKKVKAAS